MKFLKTTISALLFLGLFVAAQAQTADDIINKYVTAIGGKDLISKIKTMSIEGNVSAMGSDFPATISAINGKAYKMAVSVNGSDIINCVTDTGAWVLNPMMGQTTAQASPPEQVKLAKSSLYIGGPLVDYKEKGFKAEYIGRDTAQAKSYKIKLTDGNGLELMYFIDPNTYYVTQQIIKANVNGTDISISNSYADYKKTDLGYVVAHTIGTTNSGYDITITYNKVEFNKDIDPKSFAMPKN